MNSCLTINVCLILTFPNHSSSLEKSILSNACLYSSFPFNFINGFGYIDDQIISGANIKIYNLLICGKDIVSENYSIIELSYTIEPKKDEIDTNYSNMTYLTEKISSILFIPSEKLQNSVVVLGTFDGKIIITKSPINEADYKYKELFVHKGRITKLIYSKET